MARPPTSTIVLAVVTCIPFGLALRDTLPGTYDQRDALDEFDRAMASGSRAAIERDRADDPDDVDHDLDDVTEEAALRNAAYAESRRRAEALQEARLAQLPALYGAEPATFGPDLARFELGTPLAKETHDDLAPWSVTVRSDGVASGGLEVELFPRDPRVCDALQHGLRERWGEPKLLGPRWVWIAASQTQRAIWQPDECELAFERIVPITAWLDRTRASTVPLWAVGRPAKELRAALGARVIDDEVTYQLRWTAPALGVGFGPADLIADLEHDRVVSLQVAVEIDPLAQTALSERISKLVGEQPEIPSDRPDAEIWKTTPRLELVEGAPKTFLTIGVRP